MKCDICKKYRKTAPHYGMVPTPDGQEIQEYDFADLCMECSRGQYHWNLHAEYIRLGSQFLRRLKTNSAQSVKEDE